MLKFLGSFFLAFLIGYTVGVFTLDSGSSRYYVFKIVTKGKDPKTAPLKFGFACQCKKSPGTSTVSWIGWPDSKCSSGIPDMPISLGDSVLGNNKILPAPQIPPGACCMNKPRIGNLIMPKIPSGSC